MIEFLWLVILTLACFCGALLGTVMWLGKELKKFNMGRRGCHGLDRADN